MSRDRADVLALCYHAVSDSWNVPIAIEPRRLERQLTGLLRRGYEPTTFGEALTSPPARRTLAVTFDDGLRSVATTAAPILDRLGIPATLFAVTAFVGAQEPVQWAGLEGVLGTADEHELAPLDWEDLEALHRAGWEIGSHSADHVPLTGLSGQELTRQLVESRTTVEQRLGVPCTSIAYPYGAVDERVVAAARDAGYRAGGGLLPDHTDRDPLRFPRVFVSRADGEAHLRLRLSRSLRSLQATRAWAALGPGSRPRS